MSTPEVLQLRRPRRHLPGCARHAGASFCSHVVRDVTQWPIKSDRGVVVLWKKGQFELGNRWPDRWVGGARGDRVGTRGAAKKNQKKTATWVARHMCIITNVAWKWKSRGTTSSVGCCALGDGFSSRRSAQRAENDSACPTHPETVVKSRAFWRTGTEAIY